MKLIKPGDEETKNKHSHGWYRKKYRRLYYKNVKCIDDKIPRLGRSDGCGAKLEISEKDLVHFYWHGTHFPHSYAGFYCVYCGKVNGVDNLPSKVWKNVEKKKKIFDGFSEKY